MRTIARTLAGLSAGIALAIAGTTLNPATALAQSSKPNVIDRNGEKVDVAKAPKRDQLIFRNGNKVEGIVMSETETSVRVMVIVGNMRSESTYEKAEILEIKRDAFKDEPKKDDDKADAKKDDAKSDDGKKDIDGTEPVFTKSGERPLVGVNNKPIPEGNLKVYVVRLPGEMTRDVTPTPIKEIMDDVARVQPDILILRFNQAFGYYGEQNVDFARDAGSFDLLEKAREIDTLISNRLRDDPNIKVKPRTVAWIEKALGAAAFLPFTFPEIYFTSNGVHGGIGGLESVFGSMGDDVVREKQRSLRLARAQGLVEKGGHDKRLMTAMSRGDYILSYRVVGGKVEFLENKMPPSPEWILIKDDGVVNEQHRDSMPDVVRMQGNDFLTLDAKTAYEIGLSKGTSDSLEDLLSQMGITRNWTEVKSVAPEVFREWSQKVARAEESVQKLWRDYQRVEVRAPGGFQQRTAARGQQKQLLRRIQTIVRTYKEAINPRAIRGAPDNWIDNLEILIDRIEQAQRLDRP